MKKINEELKTLKMLLIVWFLALALASIMYTISLMYEVYFTIILSGIIGTCSVIGIFYTAFAIIRINEAKKLINNI